MKKKILWLFIIGLLSLTFLGIFSACQDKDVVVPKPEVVGDENSDCEHEYEILEEVEATCTVRAHTVYVCTICENVYTIYSGELGEHTLADRHITGNCQSYGYTERYCTACNKIIATVTDSYLGEHNFKKVNRHTNGDCRTLGYTVNEECSICKQQKITYDSAYGNHKYGSPVYTAATCVSYDYYTSTCSLCGDVKIEYGTDIKDHELTETVIPGADCTQLATIVRSCKKCDYRETEATAVYGPHNYTNTGDGSKHTCSVCGSTADHTQVTRSLSDEGHLSSCLICGYVYESGPHTYGAPVTVDATCQADGSVTQKCTVCNHAYSYVIPARHVYTFEADSHVEKTCTNDGYYVYRCDCGSTVTVPITSTADDCSVGVVPTLTLTGDYSDTTTLLFGSYPQERVTSPTLLVTLKKKLPTLPTAERRGDWTVYSYCQSAPYAWYIDVSQGGELYRAVYFTSYRPSSTLKTPSSSSSLVDDNGYEAGVVHWFKFSPLSWTRVSYTASSATFLASAIADAEQVGSYDGEFPLYTFLRTTFYQTAFSAAEKETLNGSAALSFVSADDFALLTEDLLLKSPTDYARSQGVATLFFTENASVSPYSTWWLAPQDRNAKKYDLSSLMPGRDRATGHNYICDEKNSYNLRTPATCSNYSTYYFYCSVCNELSDEYIEYEGDGLTLHSYTYIHSDSMHTYGCSVCGEILLQEAHSFTYTADSNGLSHKKYCSVCGYSQTELHEYSSLAKCVQCSAEMYSYEKYWDVSANNDLSLVAYLNGAMLTFRGTGFMKNYSSTVHPPYYDYRASIQNVNFSSTLLSIGDYAFCDFTALEYTTVPSTVKTIGKYAFSNTGALRELTFSAVSCGDLGANNNVFSAAGNNMTVTIGENVERIPSYLFYPSNNNLPSIGCIVGGKGLLTIGEYAFYTLGSVVYQNSTGAFAAPSLQKIGAYAFYNNSSLARFVLSDDLSSVGEYAFYNCLSTAFIGDPCFTSVGKYAFYGCSGLLSLRLSSTTSIPKYSFYNAGLKTAALPEGLTKIEEYAFYGCSDLATTDLPATLITIEDYAFYDGGISGSYTLDNVNLIGQYAFYGCDHLTAFYAPKLTTMGSYAFAYCSRLSSFSAQKLTVVPTRAFAEDHLLTEVLYENDLVSILQEAFLRCYRLHRILLPASLTAIGSDAFNECFTLVEIDNRSSLNLRSGSIGYGQIARYAKRIYNGSQSGATSALTKINGFTYLSVADKDYLVGYESEEKTLTLETGSTVLAYAFYASETLEKVVVHSQGIEKYAFKNCTALVEVVLESTVSAVDKTAFSGDRIAKLTVNGSDLQTSIDDVENKAYFTNATVLSIYYEETDVTPSPTPIGDLTIIKEGTLDGTEISFVYRKDGSLSLSGSGEIPAITDSVLFGARSIVIGSGITGIGASAFTNFSSLTSIDLPDGIVSIGNSAFSCCYALTGITLPTTITSIGTYAFAECYSLQEINYNCINVSDLSQDNFVFYLSGKNASGIALTIGKDCEKIPAYLFNPVFSLSAVAPKITSVSFAIDPAALSLGSYCFRNLTSVSVLDLFDTVTLAGTAPLSGMTGLRTLTVPSITSTLMQWFGTTSSDVPASLTDVSVLSLPSSTLPQNAFSGCQHLETIILPSGITSIGSRAFKNCSALNIVRTASMQTPFTLLTSVGQEAFMNCSSLLDLSLLSQTGFSLERSALEGCLSLREVSFNHLNSVQERAFLFCNSLTTFNVENSALYILDSTDENGAKGFGIYVTAAGNKLSLVAYAGNASSYTVPNVYSDYTVTQIKTEALASQPLLKQVTVGSNVKTIETNAFAECVSLTQIVFAEGSTLETIEANAFRACSALSTVSLPSTVQTIGDNAFSECTALKNIVLPSSVTSLGEGVFHSCRKLTSVTFGTGIILNYLPERAFYSCVMLENVTLPSSVTAIGASAFEQCSSLHQIGLTSSITSIGDRAFSFCKNLSSFTLTGNPGTSQSLGNNVFNGCSGLKSIVLPSTIGSLGLGVFSGCSGLTDLTIPFASASETADGKNYTYPFGYFFGTTSYSSAVKTEQSYIVTSNDTSSYVKVTYYMPPALANLTILGKGLPDGTFMNCSSLQSIDLHRLGLGTFNSRLFYGCSNLTSIDFPPSLFAIQDEVFYGCSSLSSMVLPSTVTTVSKSAFYRTGLYSRAENWEDGVLYLKVEAGDGYVYYAINSVANAEQKCNIKEGTVRIIARALENSSFTELYIPSSVRYIDEGILQGNTKITLISTPFIGSSSGIGEQSADDYSYLAYFFGVKLSTNENVQSAKQLANSTFSANGPCIPKSLVTLILTGSGTIPEEVCNGCNTLRFLTLQGNYTSLSSFAFSNCELLSSVAFGSTLTTIGSYAFENCTALTEIVVPNSVSYIGIGAFAGCTALTVYSVPFIGESPTSTVISRTCIGYNFYPSSSTTAFNLQENGNYVPELLTAVVITGDTTYIPRGAFYGCGYLKTIVFNSSISDIRQESFAGCSSLESVYILGSGEFAVIDPYSLDEAFINAYSRSGYRIYFESANAEAFVRPLSRYIENSSYSNPYSSFFQSNPYYTNVLYTITSTPITSFEYHSSDTSVATFTYSYEFDENKNGIIESSEKASFDYTSTGDIILLKGGTTTITVSFKIAGYIPVTVSYDLTVQESN